MPRSWPVVPLSPKRGRPLRVVVVGDLVLDVVFAPSVELAVGTDVPGHLSLVQGGSAATTARWLGRLGARTSLVCAVGRDAIGRALLAAVRGDGVTPRVVRVPGARTGRIGVFVSADGERSFVQDRGAALLLAPRDLRPEWFRSADVVHVPVYSLLGEPLGQAGRRAVGLARGAGAAVSSDLSSIGPLMERGRRDAQALLAEVAPDLLFATAAEAEAFLGANRPDRMLQFASTTVIKRGAEGATVLARGGAGEGMLRVDVATRHVSAADTTGAGDAFTAGFLVDWFDAQATSTPRSSRTRSFRPVRAARAGHRIAARHLLSRRAELRFDR